MYRRVLSVSVAVLLGMAMTTSLASSTFAAGGSTTSAPQNHAGPSCPFTTELNTNTAVPMKDAAVITKTHCGYRYRAGQQNSKLLITVVKGGLRFADTGTEKFNRLTPGCKAEKHVRKGVVAVCTIPKGYSAYNPLLIEIWPRLGDDYVDASSLPAMFSEAFLSDQGNDVGHLGAGPDFFNGGPGRDRVTGGAGDDWLRTGEDNDRIWGDTGNDYLAGVDGSDAIDGGDGADQIFCGSGPDEAIVDNADVAMRLCEKIDHN